MPHRQQISRRQRRRDTDVTPQIFETTNTTPATQTHNQAAAALAYLDANLQSLSIQSTQQQSRQQQSAAPQYYYFTDVVDSRGDVPDAGFYVEKNYRGRICRGILFSSIREVVWLSRPCLEPVLARQLASERMMEALRQQQTTPSPRATPLQELRHRPAAVPLQQDTALSWAIAS